MRALSAVEGGRPRAVHGRVALAERGPDEGAGIDGRLGGGLARGALHEVFAAGPGDEAAATGVALAAAARLGGRLLWVMGPRTGGEWGLPFASGIARFGLDPARLVLFAAPNVEAALAAAEAGLRTGRSGHGRGGGLDAVLCEIGGATRALDLVASRRLALAAERSGVTALLLRFQADAQPSAAASRLLVAAAPSRDPAGLGLGPAAFTVDLDRNRFGPTGRLALEWDAHDRLLREPALPRGGAAAPAHRPAEAAWPRRAATV